MLLVPAARQPALPPKCQHEGPQYTHSIGKMSMILGPLFLEEFWVLWRSRRLFHKISASSAGASVNVAVDITSGDIAGPFSSTPPCQKFPMRPPRTEGLLGSNPLHCESLHSRLPGPPKVCKGMAHNHRNAARSRASCCFTCCWGQGVLVCYPK